MQFKTFANRFANPSYRAPNGGNDVLSARPRVGLRHGS